jgi:hypothetical protein
MHAAATHRAAPGCCAREQMIRDAKLWRDTETAPQAEKLCALLNTTVVSELSPYTIAMLAVCLRTSCNCAPSMLSASHARNGQTLS